MMLATIVQLCSITINQVVREPFDKQKLGIKSKLQSREQNSFLKLNMLWPTDVWQSLFFWPKKSFGNCLQRKRSQEV